MRTLRAAWVALLALAPAAGLPIASKDLVPLRWAWNDAKPLTLLAGTAVNCVLLPAGNVQVARAAAAQGLVALATIRPGGEAAGGDFQGVVLEGDFPPSERLAVLARAAKANQAVIELTSRARLFAGAPSDGVTGTYDGLWPGIQIQA
ncbi:MAG: hypothetical protein NTY38_30660, partial [Acidobacteria bacterium]|nr:hypothetical protein [Acidobacteriota bacterium]